MPDHKARARAVYDHYDDQHHPSVRRRRQVADWGVGEEIFDHMPGTRFDRRPGGHREPPIPRGGADDGRHTIVIEPTDGDVPPDALAGAEFASRDDALRAHEAHEELWAGDEPFTEAEEPSVADELAARAEAFDEAYGSTEVDAAGVPIAAHGGLARGAAHAGLAHGDAHVGAARGDAHVGAARGDAHVGAARGDAHVGAARGDAHVGAARGDAFVRGGHGGRRTVKIAGRPGELHSSPARRRPPPTVSERLASRPDRLAAWAFVLGLLLILIAVATANV